jgi:hypothetical protein
VRGTLRAALPAEAAGGVSNIVGVIMSPAYHVLPMVLKCMQHLLDRVLRKIFGTKWKRQENGDIMMVIFIICSTRHVLLR